MAHRLGRHGGHTMTGTETSAGGSEAADGIEREIGYEDFSPIGTATLIAIYFAILVVLWVFTYFVEFLGRNVTVIG